MDPVVYLVVLGVTAVAAYVFGRATASSGDESALPSSEDSPSASPRVGKVETKKDAQDDVRAQLQEAEKTAKQAESELRKLRDEVKDAKQRAHDRGQRLEQARKELDDERRKNKNLGSIEAARQDMLAAREEVERLEAELRQLRDSAPARPEPVVAETTVDASSETSETIRRYESILDARDAEFRKDFRTQAEELRASFHDQVSEERNRYKGEIRSLQQRLRNALRDLDRERRRSEANDRAYLILKSQLEGTLDRLAVHDPSLRRPDALDPPATPPAETPASS